MFGVFDYRLRFADDVRLRAFIVESPTVLLHALRNRYHKVALRLIQLDPVCCDVVDKGETPFLYTCRERLPVIATAILDAHPTVPWWVHHVDPEGRTALFWACQNQWDACDDDVRKGMVTVFNRLVMMKGVDYKRVDKAGDSLLSLGIKKAVHVTSWIKTGLFDLHHVDAKGNTLLFLAVEARDGRLVKTILERGIDVSKPGVANHWGKTPLISASECYKPLVKIVTMLLATGESRPTYRDPSGRTALHYALQHRCVPVCHLLLDTGLFVDPHDRDRAGHSLLELACQGELYEIVTRMTNNDITRLVQTVRDKALKDGEEKIRRTLT